MAEYATLTARDLTGFDKEARALVLTAIEQGATARVSSRGHAILRGPDGVSTASVPPHLVDANRGTANAHAQVRRLFPDTAVGSALRDAVSAQATNGKASLAASPEVFTCPDCGKEFSKAQSLRGHQTGAHRRGPESPCPDCGRTFPSLNALGIHRAFTHGVGKGGKANAHTPVTLPDVTEAGAPRPSEQVHYACPVCGQVGTRPRTVKTHARAAHDRSIVPIEVRGPMPTERMSKAAQKLAAQAARRAAKATDATPEATDTQSAPEAVTEAPMTPVATIVPTPDAPDTEAEAEAASWVRVGPEPAPAPAPVALDAPERLAQVARDLRTPDVARDALSAYLADVLREHAQMRTELVQLRAERDDLKVRLEIIREAVHL